MRVVQAAALTAAAMLFASITSAQGLGAAAAREKEKRAVAPAKPAKVYSDSEVASTPTSSAPEAAPGQEGAAVAEGGAEAKAEGGEKSEKAAAADKAAADEKAAAEADWRKRMDTARKLQEAYKDVIAKLEADLGDLSTASYGPGRASKVNFVEENKQKLVEMQANIAKLEEEGRRNAYR
jgi:colicin import membrane protein